MAEVFGEANALEQGMMRDFQDVCVFQRMEKFVWDLFPAGQVGGNYRPVVKCVGQQ